MKTVVFWLAMVTMVATAFAESNGYKGGGWSDAVHSDTILGGSADTICFSLSMEATTFFGLSLTLDSLTGTSDSIGGRFRTLRKLADSSLAVGTPFTPILWQTGEYPTDTSRWIGDFRDNSLWYSTNISPHLGEYIQIILDVEDTDSIPYVLELDKTDGEGF